MLNRPKLASPTLEIPNLTAYISKQSSEPKNIFDIFTCPIFHTNAVSLQEVGDKLLDIEDENVDKDSGVEKSVEGDWNVKSRERMAKRHQQGVNSLKVARVGK